jgi:hypothetical protein
MSAGVEDLDIEQGCGYSVSFSYRQPDGVTPVNVTSWTSKMEIRTGYGVAPVLTVGTATGEIVVDGTHGKFTLSLTAVQTSLLGDDGAPYIYDILLTPPGQQPIRLVEGSVSVSLAVTT